MQKANRIIHGYTSISLILRIFIGFIIGVVQDSVETALNSSGDVFFTAVAEQYDKEKKK